VRATQPSAVPEEVTAVFSVSVPHTDAELREAFAVHAAAAGAEPQAVTVAATQVDAAAGINSGASDDDASSGPTTADDVGRNGRVGMLWMRRRRWRPVRGAAGDARAPLRHRSHRYREERR
jgi:hypothetical protein